MVGEGRIVEGSLSLVILCPNGDLTLKKSTNHHILAVVTSHVEWSTAMIVDGIRLRGEEMEGGKEREGGH